jgi:hypothetical protein
MKITESFVGIVTRLQYATFENKKNFQKETDPVMYVCNVTVEEVGRDLSRFKQYHNLVLYLTEEEYNTIDEEKNTHCFIEKGDRIRINAGAKWQSHLFEYTSYKDSVIDKVDRSKLQVDKNGKVFFSEKVLAYKVVAKIGDWGIETKWYDQNYCTIPNSRVKLPLLNKAQFKETTLEFFLDPIELNILEDYDGQVVKLIAYSNGTKFAEKEMTVHTKVDKSAKINYLLLEDVEG